MDYLKLTQKGIKVKYEKDIDRFLDMVRCMINEVFREMKAKGNKNGYVKIDITYQERKEEL